MDTGTTFFIFTVLPNKVAEALTRFFVSLPWKLAPFKTRIKSVLTGSNTS
jgi:hypothetical protein